MKASLYRTDYNLNYSQTKNWRRTNDTFHFLLLAKFHICHEYESVADFTDMLLSMLFTLALSLPLRLSPLLFCQWTDYCSACKQMSPVETSLLNQIAFCVEPHWNKQRQSDGMYMRAAVFKYAFIRITLCLFLQNDLTELTFVHVVANTFLSCHHYHRIQSRSTNNIAIITAPHFPN